MGKSFQDCIARNLPRQGTGVAGEEVPRRPYRTGADGWPYGICRVGSWVLEEPIHFFDLARWYLAAVGEPLTVYATAKARQADHPELRDDFGAIVTFPGEAYAVISQNSPLSTTIRP